MNSPRYIFIAAFILGLSLKGFSQKEEVCYNPNLVKDTTKKSIKSVAAAVLNGDSVIIRYHSPGVRKRIIWGGLVPMDEVWVTGAHDATLLETRTALKFGDKVLKPGKYALFTIPNGDAWTFVINKNYQQHLASEYDEKDDILRMQVKPLQHDHTERLQYFIKPGDANTGTLSMAWEKVRIDVPFTHVKSK